MNEAYLKTSTNCKISICLLCQFYVGLCTMLRAMITMMMKLIKWFFKFNHNIELGRDMNFRHGVSH